MTGVKVVSTVLCDEVRREADGNSIIIGVQQAAPVAPASEGGVISRLGLYMEFETSYPLPKTISVRIFNKTSKSSLIEHEFPIEVEIPGDIPEEADARGVLAVVINRQDILVEQAGEYFVQFKAGSASWRSARSYVFAKG